MLVNHFDGLLTHCDSEFLLCCICTFVIYETGNLLHWTTFPINTLFPIVLPSLSGTPGIFSSSVYHRLWIGACHAAEAFWRPVSSWARHLAKNFPLAFSFSYRHFHRDEQARLEIFPLPRTHIRCAPQSTTHMHHTVRAEGGGVKTSTAVGIGIGLCTSLSLSYCIKVGH
jgi:hypothetical protein